jgi:hypothetical protein
MYRRNSLNIASCICCGTPATTLPELLHHMKKYHTEAEIKEAIQQKQKSAIMGAKTSI